MGKLDGKVALITGGNKGIGQGIARGLAAEGASLVLTARGAEELKRTAGELILQGASVIAVPAASAQRVVDLVTAAGIKAVLNFSPGALQVPDDVKLKSVDLTVSLESLSFFLAHGDGEDS